MATSMIPGEEYNTYYSTYIDLVLSKPLLPALRDGLDKTVAFFNNLPAVKHEYRYAEGKWTPKEILLHLIDTERVFCYRALQFARAKNVVLEGFDQDEFALNSSANSRELTDLIAEYKTVRAATISFIENCSDDVLLRKGIASNSPLSVRAAAYICCGHEVHHINIINERYFD